jgi:hypothetical protein
MTIWKKLKWKIINKYDSLTWRSQAIKHYVPKRYQSVYKYITKVVKHAYKKNKITTIYFSNSPIRLAAIEFLMSYTHIVEFTCLGDYIKVRVGNTPRRSKDIPRDKWRQDWEESKKYWADMSYPSPVLEKIAQNKNN